MMNWREINTRYIYPAEGAKKEGRLGEAESILLEGLAKTDNDGNIALNYARLLYEQNRYYEAEQYCSMAERNCPWDEYKYEARVLKRKALKALNYSGSNSEAEIGLISCTRFKRDERCKAKDMYGISPDFSRHMKEAHSYDKTYILSARYGLLDPEWLIEPYDWDFREFEEFERRAWAHFIFANLVKEFEIGKKIGRVRVHCDDLHWKYICRAGERKGILCEHVAWL